MLRAEKISSAEKDLYEVKYRKEQSARIKAEKEIQHAIEEKRRIADKYINLRNIAAAKGIAVPEELDELEKIESAAAAYQAMTNNSNSSMVS